jgi:5-methylcytosine-specific restriction endonuclease McrA
VKTHRKKALVARAGSRCEDCGTDEGPFHAHHIVPQGLGGTHDLGNLILLCEDCHSGTGWAKYHSSLVAAGLVVPPRGVQLEIA